MTNLDDDEKESVKLWEGNADSWTELSRLGYDICRDGLNAPHFISILPDTNGLTGIDIGCGEGTNTRLVANSGCRLVGLDPSVKFIEHANAHQKNASHHLSYVVGSATNLPFEDESFDFAISTMCLMDVPDLDSAIKESYRVLKPGGFFQFSIVHPCFSPPSVEWIEEPEKAPRLKVGSYFEEGKYIEDWSFSALPEELSSRHKAFRVAHYHRTLSTWINTLIKNGYTIEYLHEPYPDDEIIARYPGLSKLQQVSWFLHMRVRKPFS